MREIKFRAWEKSSNEMIYDVQSVSRKRIVGESACESFQEVVDSWEYETMQYTGLKDKNGKDIYEGDVVKCWSGNPEDYLDYRSVEGVVKYNAPYWRVNDNHLAWYAENVEIIGNIYENPDLLEGESNV